MVFGWLFGRRGGALDAPAAVDAGDDAALLDAVVSGMPDAAIVLDREGRVISFNNAARMIAPALARGAPASLALRVPEVVEAVRDAATGKGPRSVEFAQRVPVDRWFKVHVEGGSIVARTAPRAVLVPINTRFGMRLSTKRFYKLIDWLMREKLTLVKDGILYVKPVMNTSRRGGVAVGSRVSKSFRAKFQGSKRRPSGFDIKLNEQGLLAVRTGPDGKQHGVLTPHGPHGTSYIQINPETGEIRCGACAGDLDSTVRE